MARIGEEDDRWIVNDLGVAGRNVGRWHWTEEDVIQWCKDELKNQFNSLILFQNDESTIKIFTTSTKSVKGEATVMNRKRKLIPIYELDIEIGWKAFLTKDKSNVNDISMTDVNTDNDKVFVAKGSIKIPYLSEENESDFEMNIDLDSSCKNQEHKQLKELLRNQGLNIVKTEINVFLQKLRAGANVLEKYKLIEEEEKKVLNGGTSSTVNTTSSSSVNNNTTNKNVTESVLGINMGHVSEEQTYKKVKIEITEKFKGAPKAKIFEFFTEPNLISQYTQAKATMEKKVGGKFSLFNGKVYGEIIEFIPNSKIVQKWRFDDWVENIYSNVTLEFEDKGSGETIVKLTQIDVPFKDKNGYYVKEKVQAGWEDNFFRRIKTMLGMIIGTSGF
ncbi:hypothetical protein ABK040_000394 [Willaertia magna]